MTKALSLERMHRIYLFLSESELVITVSYMWVFFFQAYLLDFRHECEKKEAFDEIQAGFNYLHKVINELCWLAEAVGYLEEETNYKKLN